MLHILTASGYPFGILKLFLYCRGSLHLYINPTPATNTITNSIPVVTASTRNTILMIFRRVRPPR